MAVLLPKSTRSRLVHQESGHVQQERDPRLPIKAKFKSWTNRPQRTLLKSKIVRAWRQRRATKSCPPGMWACDQELKRVFPCQKNSHNICRSLKENYGVDTMRNIILNFVVKKVDLEEKKL